MAALLIILVVSVKAYTIERNRLDTCGAVECSADAPVCAVQFGQVGSPTCTSLAVDRTYNLSPHQHGAVEVPRIQLMWTLNGTAGWAVVGSRVLFRWTRQLSGHLLLAHTVDRNILFGK